MCKSCHTDNIFNLWALFVNHHNSVMCDPCWYLVLIFHLVYNCVQPYFVQIIPHYDMIHHCSKKFSVVFDEVSFSLLSTLSRRIGVTWMKAASFYFRILINLTVNFLKGFFFTISRTDLPNLVHCQLFQTKNLVDYTHFSIRYVLILTHFFILLVAITRLCSSLTSLYQKLPLFWPRPFQSWLIKSLRSDAFLGWLK